MNEDEGMRVSLERQYKEHCKKGYFLLNKIRNYNDEHRDTPIDTRCISREMYEAAHNEQRTLGVNNE